MITIKEQLDNELAETAPGIVCVLCHRSWDKEPKKHKDNCPVVLQAQLAQAKDRIMDLEEALKEEVDQNYLAQARIEELEGLVRQALEVVNGLISDKELEIISYMSPNCGRDYYFCSICGAEAKTKELIVHKDDCLYLKMVAIIPALDKELEKV